jgi:hypothetical protein
MYSPMSANYPPESQVCYPFSPKYKPTIHDPKLYGTHCG